MITLINAQRTGLFDVLGRLWYLAATEKASYQNRKTVIQSLAGALTAGAVIPTGQSQAALRYQVETISQTALGITQQVLQLTKSIVQAAVSTELSRKVSAEEAAEYIAAQARSAGYYVGNSNLSATTQSDAGNRGDAQLLIAPYAPDGYPGALWVPESGQVDFDTLASATSPDALSLTAVDWPGGSGYAGNPIPMFDLGAGYLQNSELAISDGRLGAWIVIGTSWDTIAPPQDEIQFSANPTGGIFRLSFTNRFGVVRWTKDIPYNASPTLVAAEIAALDTETRTISVTQRSSGPGYTIDWPRGRYDLPMLGIYSALSGATASVVRTRAGVSGAYAGNALRFLGNGSELTGLYQRVQLAKSGVAYLVARIWHDGATAGTLQLGLFDSVGSSANPIPRASGSPNASTFNLASLAANQFHLLAVPITWTDTVDGYIGIRLTAAISNTKKLVINWPQLIPISEQTITRPGLILLRNRFGPDKGDKWQWIVTNDFAGGVQTWWLRAFGDNSLALPRAGTTLIPESIISP